MTDRQLEGGMNGCTVGQTVRWMEGWLDGQTDRWKDGGVHNIPITFFKSVESTADGVQSQIPTLHANVANSMTGGQTDRHTHSHTPLP